jgi:hypothetical protein
MKIKIVSDGELGSTKVVSAETGEEIDGVQQAIWHAHANGIPYALITVFGVAIEATVERADIHTLRDTLVADEVGRE